MIYPKDIIGFVSNGTDLTARFSPANVGTTVLLQQNFSFEEYILNEGFQKSWAIRKYLYFIASTYSIFNEIFQYSGLHKNN